MRWTLRYSLSFRDAEELLSERGLEADHTAIWRWVQRYGPELEQRLRRRLKPTNKSWRVDETCAARRTIQGYEAMHMIRKGQAKGGAVRIFGDYILDALASSI